MRASAERFAVVDFVSVHVGAQVVYILNRS